MPRYIQTVATRPVPGRAAEFNRWYDEIHLPEVLAVPGFVAGQRFVRSGADPGDVPQYLAVYEVETNDLGATLATLAEAGATMTPSEAMDLGSTVVTVYQALGERRVAGAAVRRDGAVDGR